jgi:hypothetical protein
MPPRHLSSGSLKHLAKLSVITNRLKSLKAPPPPPQKQKKTSFNNTTKRVNPRKTAEPKKRTLDDGFF